MILKRLKLFTAGLPGTPGYTFSNYDSVMNNNNNSNNANTNAGNGNNANLADGSNANSANTGNTGAGAGSANPKPGANATTSAASAAATTNGANNSGSVMQKQSYDKPSVSTNNVKSDTAQAYNKEQLDNINKTHKQELKNSYAQGAKRGEQAGMRKASVWQGLKNTWRSAGTMKKIGMGGAALAGTYFLGKGLLGGNNNNDQ